jgi:hypothetical protein
MERAMGHDRVGISIQRIERALARIETVADRAMAAPVADSGVADELRRAHQALRFKVEGALAEIDDLLASQQEQG